MSSGSITQQRTPQQRTVSTPGLAVRDSLAVRGQRGPRTVAARRTWSRSWPQWAGIVLLAVLAAVDASARAETRLPAIFGDSMVLQRQAPIPVWGWDEPGQSVKVSLDGATATAEADAQGRWQVELPAREAGGPFTLAVQGSSPRQYKDVLVGEVWLCSGQSNMEWTVRRSNDAEREIAEAKYPQIRHIKIERRPAATPQEDVVSRTGWARCTPQDAANFTAVGYFFGRELHRELNVPVGLIGSNWGGTRIEPWTPPSGFRSVPALDDIAGRLGDFPLKSRDGKVNHQSPLALYNGMIHGLVPYGLRGAIWYQGESNNSEGMLYHEKMKALIAGWRQVWKQPEMPFYFVQLAPFRYGNRKPQDLPGIWEAQLATLKKVPHTGMAVTVDIGNVKDIHPTNKQDVGRRLALWALAHDYGRSETVYSGPVYQDMKIDGDRIVLSFQHVGGGLVARDGKPLSWFTIAGSDKKFVPAEAEIVGETVVVHSPQVPNPVAVRLGWDDSAEPNLSNQAGLPASPFRTDSW